MRFSLCILGVLITLPQTSFAVGSKPTGDAHVYKTVGDRELTLYVTKPKDWADGDTRPAIVFFHGGGWVGGAPGQFTKHSQYFAGRGIVCFQVQYRLLDKKSKNPPVTCTEDARDAMLWIRTKSKELASIRSGSPRRVDQPVGTSQHSLVASTRKRMRRHHRRVVRCCCLTPVYNNGPDGWGAARVGDRFKEFSPAHNLTADDPPSIVFLGSQDKLIPVATAEKFRDDCKAVGVKSELHVYEGQGHGFFNAGRDGDKWYLKTVAAADRFLGKLGWVQGEPTLQPSP